MKSGSGQIRRKSTARSTPGVITCPSCAGPLKPDSKWCPKCQFTGNRTLGIFSDDPPPLLPILDATGILDAKGLKKIESARDGLEKRFPQFQWRVCIIDPPEPTSLPLFGFWLLNVCPLDGQETEEKRAWTILLLIHAGTGEASVVPGYAAEAYLSDDDWKNVVGTMGGPWRAGNPAEAIATFFEAAKARLDLAWKRYGVRRQVG